jgi:hypothetical protein
MSRSLPDAPSLEQLKKQAKDLLKAHRAADAAACCGVLRNLGRFDKRSDAQIVAATVSLADAQHAVAREYGLESWAALKHAVATSADVAVRGKVQHENGRTWVCDVPPLRWGQSGECTFAGAMAAALKVTKRPVPYSDLMGYSGLAFRVRWFRRYDEPGWCPSSPVGEFSEEILQLAEAIGWRVHQESRMDQTDQDMSGCTHLLRESIDAGRPVVGYPDADLNVGVCYGYEEQNGDFTGFLWNRYGKDAVAIPADKLGPWQLILHRAAPPQDRTASLRRALTTPNWRRDHSPYWKSKPQVDAVYLYGARGLKQWREDLDLVDQLTDGQRGQLFFVSWWCLDCLVDARHAAAKFLNDRAQECEGDLRAALVQAAAIHGQLAQSLSDASFKKHEAFLGPWTGKKVDDWTVDVRKREQALLTEVEEGDRRATSAIDRAVALLE